MSQAKPNESNPVPRRMFPDGEADSTHLIFVLNWFDEVRRRVASAGQN